MLPTFCSKVLYLDYHAICLKKKGANAEQTVYSVYNDAWFLMEHIPQNVWTSPVCTFIQGILKKIMQRGMLLVFFNSLCLLLEWFGNCDKTYGIY